MGTRATSKRETSRRRGMKPAAREAFSQRPLGDTADPGLPPAQGLYDPRLDKDSCGVGFIANIKGRKSHQLVEDTLAVLCNLEHRGAVGADPRAGDGAGILVQIPHAFF
jgi:glutamate synthase (NADPH/NADH) large chain